MHLAERKKRLEERTIQEKRISLQNQNTGDMLYALSKQVGRKI